MNRTREFLGKLRTRAVTSAVMASTVFATPLYATSKSEGDVFTKGEEIMNKLAGQIAGVSTAAAGLGIVIAGCFFFFSTNDRTVQNAKEWMKRIAIAWLVVNGSSFILATLQGYMPAAK